MISQIQLHHLAQVTCVHIRAFPESALTRLGPEAVRRYYEWQLVGPHGHHFIGIFDNSVLLGYAVGGTSRGAMSGFVHRNKGFLVRRVVARPWLLLGTEFRSRISAATASLLPSAKQPLVQRTEIPPRSFGILAIAVDPTAQRKGIGRLLMDSLAQAAMDNDFDHMHLSVAAANTQAIAFYEGLGWTRLPHGKGSGFLMLKDLSRSRGKPV